MKAEYKRDLQNNYLILEVPPDAQKDDYRLRMAEQNKIPGLLPFHSSKKDGALYLHYEITSKQPLASLYEKKVLNYQDIALLLGEICDILEVLQEYLLSPAQLVFDPQYIYVKPDGHKIQLCYLPGEHDDLSIIILAEFILKRLDHEDRQAVVLGYNFYQKVQEDNFSLQKTLKEMLAASKEMHTGNGEKVPSLGTRAEPAFEEERTGGRETAGVEEYEVTHQKRKERQKRERRTDRLFQMVHPAVLLSALFLLAALEIAFYFELVNITEAGGIFFLVISAETLANTYWKAAKEKKKKMPRWVVEDEDEMYQNLQEEMYQIRRPETEIEETRCLILGSGDEGLRLICTTDSFGKNSDILIKDKPLFVGKTAGKSDVILDSPTVSRMHAQLGSRDGKCYVKDLNSKNGTFCNGERLNPMEQREIHEGDSIAFAEVEYRAVKLS